MTDHEPTQSSPHPDSIAAQPPIHKDHVGKPTADTYQPIAAEWERNPGADPKAVSEAVSKVAGKIEQLKAHESSKTPVSEEQRLAAPITASKDDPYALMEQNAATVRTDRQTRLSALKIAQKDIKPENRRTPKARIIELKRAIEEQRVADKLMTEAAEKRQDTTPQQTIKQEPIAVQTHLVKKNLLGRIKLSLTKFFGIKPPNTSTVPDGKSA